MCCCAGRTMLDLACYSGHTECVETLLLQGATILVHDNISRRTPLHAAGKSLFQLSSLMFSVLFEQ